MDDFETELKKECLEEIRNNISDMFNILNKLVIKDVEASSIHEIFRLVHTIKGNTSAIDLVKTASVTHQFEDLLIRLRNKKITYTQTIHDVCLNFCDQMDDAITHLKKDFNNEPDLTELENTIKIAINSQATGIKIPIKAPGPLRVLVAEDDKTIREIIEIALEELPITGIEVEFAANGLEAFKKLYNNSYDLLITDLNMPKMDGESLIEMWRLKVFPRRCPALLVITGDDQAINALSLNDDNLYTLIKPFTLERLNKSLKLILGTIRMQAYRKLD